MEEFIGKKIKFSAQPYNRGELLITSIEEGKNGGNFWNDRRGQFMIIGTGVGVSETSRLFGCTSTTTLPDGREFRLYWYSPEQIRRAVEENEELIYVYPV